MFAFWAALGGEVEHNESDLVAAQRELREELNLVLDLEGPVHASMAQFEHNGASVLSTDVFFVARCGRDAPCLQAFTEEERAVIRDSRWWTLREIETTRENVFPRDLSIVVERMLQQ